MILALNIMPDQTSSPGRIGVSTTTTFPMFIPEILAHLKGADLEDWLTMTFIERQRQLPLEQLCSNGGYRSTNVVPDIWMLELTDRRGREWSGRFNVAFFCEQKSSDKAEPTIEQTTGELLFTLDTETAKVTFNGDIPGSAARPHHV
jgi:hypothetical protein